MSRWSTDVLNLVSNVLLETLRARLPAVRFEPGESFSWSPAQQLVCYPESCMLEDSSGWALLHEAAHGILQHCSYETDFELLLLEVAAWQKAKELAAELEIEIDEDHIQDCLDTYRDWLHRRSTCPTCGIVGLQHSPRLYACHNCNATWQVSNSRFCRAYRLKNAGQTKTSSVVNPRTMFS